MVFKCYVKVSHEYCPIQNDHKISRVISDFFFHFQCSKLESESVNAKSSITGCMAVSLVEGDSRHITTDRLTVKVKATATQNMAGKTTLPGGNEYELPDAEDMGISDAGDSNGVLVEVSIFVNIPVNHERHVLSILT